MAMSQRMWRREQERKRRERARRAKRRRTCAVVVLLIAAAVCAAVCIKGCGGSMTAGPRATETVSVSAVPTLLPETSQIPVSELDTSFYDNSVFIGNALADGISLYGLLPQTDIYAKVGISLDNAYNTAANNSSTSIVDQLKSKKFSKVFLCFGEEELAEHDAQSFYDKYSTMVDTVKDYQKSARIYLVAIPPAAESSGVSLDDILAYNDALFELAYDKDVYYSDAYTGLAQNDGYLADGVSADGINLDRNCYIEMLNYMADNSFIPDSEDIDSRGGSDEDGNTDENTDENADEEESPSSTRAPRRTAAPDNEGSGDGDADSTPKATEGVNVLKDSVRTESPSSESEDSE